ncbi:MAG: 30S ribosomal protein S2 [Chlamydiia bacterium]
MLSHKEPTIQELIEAGAHFGHQTRRWNPKMKRFIFSEENGIHIIDLSKTVHQLKNAIEVAMTIASKHKSVLFVGTKKQAKDVVKECAESCQEFYVAERWLGGMLTNLSTIRKSIKKLETLEKKLALDTNELTKKERILLGKDQIKLSRNLSGIRGMRRAPGLMIVVDPSKEDIAVLEARKLNIPVMAIVDTNCDPSMIDYVIPANDDAQKSVKVILGALADAIKIAKEGAAPLSKEESQERAEGSEKEREPKKFDRPRRPRKEPVAEVAK